MNSITLNFLYNGTITKVQCKANEYMKDIFKRYLIKINKDKNDVYFIYNGNKINDELKLEEIKNKDKDNEIKILVNDINSEINKNKIILKKSKDIICPECGEICIMDINDYKIILNKCINKHCMQNILLGEFNDSQNINELNILCNNCNKNKNEIHDNQLYKCYQCKINLCPLCKLKHNKEHTLIDYELKNYLCKMHGERFILYCKDCNINLCDLCEIGHNKSHNFIYLNKLLTDKENNIKKLKTKIENLKTEIKDIIKDITNKMNTIIDNMEIYYNINNHIIDNFNIKNKNYELLINMSNIYNYNEKIMNDINEIINETKIENKIKYIYNLYNAMIIKNEIKFFLYNKI